MEEDTGGRAASSLDEAVQFELSLHNFLGRIGSAKTEAI